MRSESLEFLRQIVDTPSPSGYEERAAEVFRQYTKDFADDIHTDFHGNVWACLNPKAEMKVMLAGHIDEIGFIVHYINEEGFLFFRGVGGHDSIIPVGQRVWVHGKERVPGIIGRKPIHLLDPSEREKRPQLHDLWIDIGASSKEEAEELIELGDCVTFQSEFQSLLGDRATARGFDNKVGAFAVAEALRLLKKSKGLSKDVGVYAVGTVQEEVGLRGARTAAYAINPQSGLAIDVEFAIDHPGLSKTRYGDAALGKGPTVTRGPNVNPVVYRMIKEAAQKEKVSLQVVPEPGPTGTDGAAMQISRRGMATGVVGVPLRYMHTPCELISLTDAEDAAKLMAGYCRLVKPDSDFTPRIER